MNKTLFQTKITRPVNPYDPSWLDYWQQNPNKMRGVGADDTDGGEDPGENPGGDPGENPGGDPGENPGGKIIPKTPPGDTEDDESKNLLAEVMEKKKTIKDRNTTITDLNKQLKKFEGIDLDEVKTLLGEKKTAEETRLKDAGDYDRLKEMMATNHKSTVDELNGTIADLNGKLTKKDKTIDDLSIGHAFNSSKYVGDTLILTPSKARVVYGNNFEIKDGVLVGYDRPVSDENKKPYVNASGDPLVFNEAIKKLVEADPERDSLIKSKLKKGADSKPDGQNEDHKPGSDNGTGLSRIANALNKGR